MIDNSQKKLKGKIKILPRRPGVYIFKDSKNKVIYIGKAISLKTRVRSYLNPKLTDYKTFTMIKQVYDLDYQAVSSEFEALLLEANLIKKYQPKYNVQLKDNKHYLYIAITKSPYRVFPVRRPELEEDLFDWYGPFPSASAARQVLQIIRRTFPYCSCRNLPRRQCLYSHLELCPGFLNLKHPNYKKNIFRLRQVLKGKTFLIIICLRKKMFLAAKELKFEEAQKYKNQIDFLEQVTQVWKTAETGDIIVAEALLRLKKMLSGYQGIAASSLNKIEGYDVSNLGKDIIVGAMVTFIDGQPEKGLYRKFKINFSGSQKSYQKMSFGLQNDPGSIEQIVSRRFNHPEWLYPQLILLDGGKPQISAAFQALQKMNLAGQICLLGLAKKEETIIVPVIKNKKINSWRSLKYSPNSPILKLLQQIRNEAHRFAQGYYHQLQTMRFFTSFEPKQKLMGRKKESTTQSG